MQRLFLLSLLTLLSVAASAQKRPITEKDLFDFHWIGDVQLAPDGRHVVFVQSQVKEDRSGYETSLYLLDLTAPGANPQLLLAGTHDSSPRWASTSDKILFVRSLEADGKPQPPQLYLSSSRRALSPMRRPCRKVSRSPRGPAIMPAGLCSRRR